MRFLMAELFFLYLFFIDYVQSELRPGGKNVCLTLMNFTDTVMVKVQKWQEKSKWCLKVKCPRRKLVYEDEPRVITKTKYVPMCCEGFREETGTSDCVPACFKECKNGKCVAPNKCDCDPGFYGDECDQVCPEGRWGINCAYECDCTEKGKCNKATGCDCGPGWTGERCHVPCQEGYYGYSCEKECNCDFGCNHETGECISPIFPLTPDYKSMTEYATKESMEVDYVIPTKRSYSSEMTEVNKEVFRISEMVSIEVATALYEGRSEKYAEKETGFSQASDLVDSISESIHSAVSSSNRIMESTEKDTTMKASSEETLNEKEVKLHWQNDLHRLETVSNSPDTDETELNLSRQTSGELSITDNDNFWIKVSDNPQNTEKNETDNRIYSGKGSSLKDTSHSKFSFLACLYVVSGISLTMFVIAAKWLIVSHKKKVKIFFMETQKEKVLQRKQTQSQEQKLFLANGFMESPTYLSEVDINNPRPILKSFKTVKTNK